jgi:hypothetical protein
MTMPNEEIQRIRSYLVTQANKLSIPELVEKVRRDSLPLRDGAASVPPERFAERPTSNDWSAAEVFTHILTMTKHGARAIEGIIAHGAPPPRVTDVITHETRAGLRTADDYWQAYIARREPFYARVLQARGDEHLDVKITHSTFGELNWREWLLFMRVHDLDHIRQLQALAQHFNTRS